MLTVFVGCVRDADILLGMKIVRPGGTYAPCCWVLDAENDSGIWVWTHIHTHTSVLFLLPTLSPPETDLNHQISEISEHAYPPCLCLGVAALSFFCDNQGVPSRRPLTRQPWEAFTFSNGTFRRAAAAPGPGADRDSEDGGDGRGGEPSRPWAGTGEAVLPPPGM